MRSARLLLAARIGVAVALIALLAAGCKKKKPPPIAGAAPIAALAAIPADATLVIGLDVGQLANSALVARALSQLFVRDPDLAQRFERLARDCGVDVTRQVRAVHLAMAPGGTGPVRRSLLVATGDLDEAALTRCLQAGIGSGGGDVTVKQLGARSLYKLTQGRRVVWFGFGAADTVVIGPDEAWVVSALGDGPKIETSKELAPRLKYADTSQAIWFVALMDADLGGQLVKITQGAIGAPPAAVWAELSPDDGLRAHAAFEMTSNADATALAGFAKQEILVGGMAAQAWGLGPAVGAVEVTAQGGVVHFRVQLSDEELKDVLAAVDSGSTRGQDAPLPADGGLENSPPSDGGTD